MANVNQGNMNPMDIAIATMIDKDLKSCASTTALSACECTSPELRQAFAQISQQSIQRQAQLSQLMMQKGAYVPPQADSATMSLLQAQLQAATAGLSQGQAGMGMQVGTMQNATAGVTAPRIM